MILFSLNIICFLFYPFNKKIQKWRKKASPASMQTVITVLI